MKNKWIKTVSAAVAAVAVAVSVQAAPITGGIAIGGGYTTDAVGGNLTTATTITVTPGTLFIVPFSDTGSLAGATGPITFATPISVNPANNLVGATLWSVKVGAVTYSFQVTSEFESVDTANQITIIGNGTFLNGTPADSSSGTFQLGIGVTQATFSFQNNSQVNVPEGGTTALLLGSALLGLGLMRKKLMAA